MSEPFPILATVAFAITALLAASVIVRANLKATSASKRLKEALVSDGKSATYLDSFAFRKNLTFHPDSIRDVSDSKEVREAKEELIACAVRFTPTLMRAMTIMALGTAATVVAGLLEFYVRK